MTDRGSNSPITRRELMSVSAGGCSFLLAGCANFISGSDNTPTESPSETTVESQTEPPPEPPDGFDVRYLGQSPSSHVAPTDGFADAGWLAGTSPTVLTVTNLDNAGEGSLRRALETSEPRIIVFEVGGIIELKDDPLFIDEPNVYVAGQTAPSPGITVIRGAVLTGAENVILQHLRVRPGDDIDEVTDCIGNIDGGTNVIVDHCSASWGTDETISTNSGKENPDITFTNNIAAECLADSIHPRGVHSYGTLVMDESKRVTIAGNLWAHNIGRHPRLKGGTTSVVVNNVTYDFERAVHLGGGVDSETSSSIVGNCYRSGGRNVKGPIIDTNFGDTEGPVDVYESDNEVRPGSISIRKRSSKYQLVDRRPLWPEALRAIGPLDAYNTVIRSVGARPADRTPDDERVISDVQAGTGSIIDSQSEVDGYPTFSSTERSLDIPDEGLAEWLYQHTKSVELPDAAPP